jgi:hypothetical protein
MTPEIKFCVLYSLLVIAVAMILITNHNYEKHRIEISRLRELKAQYPIIRVYVGNKFLCVLSKANYRQIAKWMARDSYRGCVGKDGNYQIFLRR